MHLKSVFFQSSLFRIFLRCVLFSLLVMTRSALAVTWSQQVSVPVEVDYDSNPTMLSSNIKSIWRSTITPHYTLTGIRDLDQWYADGTMRIERTSDQKVSINREDPSLTFGWKREMERGGIGIKFHYDEASSRATQLLETGQSASDTTRVSKSIGLDWQHYLTDKLSASINAEAKKATFSGGTSVPDFWSEAASATLNYEWNERMTPYFQLSANRYDPQNSQAATNQYAAVVGISVKLNERMDVSVNGGMNEVTGATQDNGWQGGGDMSYTAEKYNWKLGLSRSLSPAGNGGFISSDQAKASWGYEFSDHSHMGLDLSMRRNTGATPSETRQVGAWYGRELSDYWSVRASCRHNESSSAGRDAKDNVLGLTLTYSHPDF